jgi:SAM-dependent methyltransferase
VGARARAAAAGVADRCTFASGTTERADVIVSIDSFEHFADPADILRTMHDLLVPGGRVLASFGPTWYHPLGGHLFSVFPWAHLVLSEAALIRWRNDVRSDGATRFGEVAGGLNQMTIRRFVSTVGASPLTLERLECVPINKLRHLHSRLTREWTTAIVRATLRKPAGAADPLPPSPTV